jgi:hypothetical protein
LASRADVASVEYLAILWRFDIKLMCLGATRFAISTKPDHSMGRVMSILIELELLHDGTD